VSASGRFRIGTSGYQYDHWKDIFYPHDLPKSRWFEHYSRYFDTVEINNTFYRLPNSDVFDAWRDAAPRAFTYALKFSRYGTHMRRLRDPKSLVDYFMERAAKLGPTIGPVLVQLPPGWKLDAERLADFLAQLPRRPRWSVEFRDKSWLCESVYQLLERHRVALCMHDKFRRHPRVITTDFTYIRFHGVPFRNSYPTRALAAHARRIRGYLDAGVDVFVYFNNDADGHALWNADDLRRYVEGGEARLPATGRGDRAWKRRSKTNDRFASVSPDRTGV
jgi:uncharacterized protein YecE (DUF72 family)